MSDKFRDDNARESRYSDAERVSEKCATGLCKTNSCMWTVAASCFAHVDRPAKNKSVFYSKKSVETFLLELYTNLPDKVIYSPQSSEKKQTKSSFAFGDFPAQGNSVSNYIKVIALMHYLYSLRHYYILYLDV